MLYSQTNQGKINKIKTLKNFSKSFNILLSSKVTDIDSNMVIDVTDTKCVENGCNRTKQLRQYLNNIIQSETEATEERIDRYVKQQQASLKAFRQTAEQDYHDILR